MIILYHKNCADGFCAAWLLSKRWPDATFIAVNYGEPIPAIDYKDQDVMIVDFSYNRNCLTALKPICRSLIVLDHHKTAKEELEGIEFCTFDMNKSGARLALEYLEQFGERSWVNVRLDHMSWVVDYVEDRDLWRWKLEHSKEINTAIGATPMTFEAWDALDRFLCIQMGSIILDYQDIVIKKACKGYPFAMSYFQRADGKFIYSLRSSEDGKDVSQVAKIWGGGGHPHAAGFESDKLLW